jgi:hypothetical protein
MSNRNYLVQPNYLSERIADYKTGEELQKAFTIIPQKKMKGIGLNGNIKMGMVVNRKSLKVLVKKVKNAEIYRKDSPYVDFYEAISSALALYRTICIFKNPKIELQGANGYKCPWFIYLQHQSGEYFGLGEWKGAFGVWSTRSDVEDVPKPALDDLIKLLNLILSDKSPHPYDGCVAGSVA